MPRRTIHAISATTVLQYSQSGGILNAIVRHGIPVSIVNTSVNTRTASIRSPACGVGLVDAIISYGISGASTATHRLKYSRLTNSDSVKDGEEVVEVA